MAKGSMPLLIAGLFFSLSMVHGLADPPEVVQLTGGVLLSEDNHFVALRKGSSVQVLRRQTDTAVVNITLPDGSSLVTSIPLSKIPPIVSTPGAGTPAGAPGSPEAVAQQTPITNSVQQPTSPAAVDSSNSQAESPPTSSADNPPDDAPTLDSLSVNDHPDLDHPHYSETIASLNTDMPPAKYTALHGFFYSIIQGVAIPVVYSLPMEDQHLALTAGNLVLYCPFGGENPTLDGGLPKKLVENLGCAVFSFAVGSKASDVFRVRKAYASDDWYQAVLDARNAIIKGFGLERKQLLVFGYSAGGGRALQFTGAFPEEVEAVTAQGAGGAPPSIRSDYSSVKWLIVNNRGEQNAAITRPFYQKLCTLGGKALYAETSAEGGNYHGNTDQDDELMYTYLAGILDQRNLVAQNVSDLQRLWPYAAPKNPINRYDLVRTSFLDEDDITGGRYDLLPSGSFAAAWAKICPPTQTVHSEDGQQNIHVTFPATPKPIGAVIYCDMAKLNNITRMVEDINSLAESGCVVISPAKKMSADDYSKAVVGWLKDQEAYVSGIHILGYGSLGASFVAKIAASNELSVKSINLVDFDNATIDDDMKTAIEDEAKNCGSYSFLVYLDSKPSNDLSAVATDLVTEASQERGCSKFLITPSVTENTIEADKEKIANDEKRYQDDSNLLAAAEEDTSSGDQKSVQDRIDSYQVQLVWDQQQAEADTRLTQQDEAQADVERNRAEGQVLSMVTYRMATYH